MAYSVAIHIIGIVFWMGGLLMLTRVMAVAESPTPALIRGVKRLWMGYTLPGLLIVVISGVYQLLFRGLSFYFGPGQGWFHSKLTGIVVLIVITALLAKQVGIFCKGEKPSRKALGAFHGISALLLVILVLLTETHIQP